VIRSLNAEGRTFGGIATRLLAVGLLAASFGTRLSAQKETDRLQNSATVLNEILGMPDSIPKDLLDRAECVIVIPSVKKFAVGIGGSYVTFAGLWALPFLEQTRGMSRVTASFHASLLLLGVAFGALIVGVVSDRLSNRRGVMWLLGAFAGIALMLPATLIPSTIALSFATGVSHPLRATAIQRMTTDGMRARAASVANACDMAFSTILLLITGSWLAGRR